MSKRILVLSASVGAGHLRAAQAIELAIQELAPDAAVQNLDVLDYTNAAFRRVYGKFYLELVNHAPHLLGYFYDRFDRKPGKYDKSDAIRLILQKLNLRRLMELLKKQHWDVIVNTHFLPAEIIASLRRKNVINSPQLTVTTDFETHRLWVNQPCDHYFTATQEGAIQLAHWGVPEASITVTGIPIHPAFSKPLQRDELLKKHGIHGDRPIILQLAGGFGVGPIEELLRAALTVEVPTEIVVVAGRNEKLKQRLAPCRKHPMHRVHVLGYTNEMHEWMQLADLVMSKPGGLTTSEILASGTAMVIVNPIPGQESRNSDFLLENGAAIKINSTSTLRYKLNQLLTNRERIDQLKSNARKLGRPDAAYRVAQTAFTWPACTGA